MGKFKIVCEACGRTGTFEDESEPQQKDAYRFENGITLDSELAWYGGETRTIIKCECGNNVKFEDE